MIAQRLIREFLGTSTNSLQAVDYLEERIRAIVVEVVDTVVDRRLQQISSQAEISKPAPEEKEELAEKKTWLTSGEAFDIARNRGYNKSLSTFRRGLSGAIVDEQLPKELVDLGIICDFKTRKSANSKDNSVRWLRFEGK